tara:strand:- start:3111 stop:3419 length:309 start_codon:yes stop_codon:yes gene_type:complete
MPTAGTLTTSTSVAGFFADADGVTTIRCVNTDPTDAIDINVEGLHAAGEYYRLAPRGTGNSHIAEFTLAPLGIKSATCRGVDNGGGGNGVLNYGVVSIDPRS